MKLISKLAALVTITLGCLSTTVRGTLFSYTAGTPGASVNQQYNITVPSSCTCYSYMQVLTTTGYNDYHSSYLYGTSTGFTGIFGGSTGTVYSFSVTSPAQIGGYAEDWRRMTNVSAGNYTVIFAGGVGNVTGIWGLVSSGYANYSTEISW